MRTSRRASPRRWPTRTRARRTWRTPGLLGAPDGAVWDHAAAGGYVLLTKDEDFHRLSVVRGPPPKVVWVRLGNCATADVARLLRLRADDVARFVADPEAAFLALG